MDPDSFRSSALVPGVELWPSEWSALNRTLLTVPRDVPLLRHLRVRPLAPKHREGLRLLHTRLFPIRYDGRFYDVACGIVGDDGPAKPRDIWSTSDMIGIGLFLPRKVLLENCDCGDVICCESSSSSSGSVSSQRSSPTSEDISPCTSSARSDEPPSAEDVDPTSNGENPGYSAAADDVTTTTTTTTITTNYDIDCILNDATYDPENEEFLVGFATMLINRSEYSDVVPGEDFFWLDSFFQDMMLPYFQGCDVHDKYVNRFLNFDLISADFHRFLYSNLYRDDVMLEYLSRYRLHNCRTVYLLSAGITMGLRSRLLGTYLILFVQCIIYFCGYGVFVYNRDLYHCPETVRDPILAKLDLHLSNASDSTPWLELDDVSESEIGPYRLSAESLVQSYRRCEEMPITIYLHVIAYNRKACAMYRRTNFVCVTRYDDYYVINAKQYPANVLAYYVYPPCGY